MAPTRFEEARALHHAGELERAAALYRAAIDEDPGDFRSRHNLGAVLESLGDAAGAEAAYSAALATGPDAAWTHYNLARLRHLAGRLDEAEAGYRLALEREPELVEAHFNLGRLLLERGDAGGAEAALRERLRRGGEDAGTESYLGDALFAQQRLPEALEAYRRTAAIDPEDAAAHYDVGKALEQLKRLDEAVGCYRRCVALDPFGEAPREGLARALLAAGHRDEAVASLREWSSVAPGNPVAAHLLASLGAGEVPDRASDAYVRRTFDRFAADFDATLARLDYRAPQMIAAAAALACGAPAGALDVLDLGCGTGLCAPILRPWARRLEGVDLSAAMLERARRRGGYDALHEAEITRFLGEYRSSWDLIASADTLCYFGSLEPVLRAAAGALRAGGVLAYTLERLAAAGGGPGPAGAAARARPGGEHGGYALQAHGRYAHEEGHVRAVMEAAGFATTVIHGALRSEGGQTVEGMLIVGKLA
jgi:predicted TPR repeat methyltransferase